MKIIIVLFWFITVSAFGQGYSLHDLPFLGSGNDTSRWVVVNSFEAGTKPSDWGEFGTVNWAYITPPAPLSGTNSIYIGSSELSVNFCSYTNAISPELWIYFQIYTIGSLTNAGFVSAMKADGSYLLALKTTSTNTYQLFHGTVSQISAIAMSSSLTNHIWLYYGRGNGSNGIGKFWVSNTGVRPITPSIEITTGDGNGEVSFVRLHLSPDEAGYAIFDEFKLSNRALGNWP
jgi:hypothetical protein